MQSKMIHIILINFVNDVEQRLKKSYRLKHIYKNKGKPCHTHLKYLTTAI